MTRTAGTGGRRLWGRLPGVGIAVVALALASTAAQAQVLDSVAADVQYVMDGLQANIRTISVAMFLALLTLEVSLMGLDVGFGPAEGGASKLIAYLAKRLLVFGLLFALVTGYTSVFPAIVAGWEQFGAEAGSISVLNPSDVVDLGFQLHYGVQEPYGAMSLLTEPIVVLSAFLKAWILLFAYMALGLQMTRVVVEAYIALGLGNLFIAFTGNRVTVQLGENYIGYIVRLGIRLAILYVIVGVGMRLAVLWRDELLLVAHEGLSLKRTDSVVMGSLLFAVVALTVPGRIAREVGSPFGVGLVDALRSKPS